MKITLVRHTRVALPQGTCYGWSDVPVADSFEAEAKQTLQNLKAHEPFDAVFSCSAHASWRPFVVILMPRSTSA